MTDDIFKLPAFCVINWVMSLQTETVNLTFSVDAVSINRSEISSSH